MRDVADLVSSVGREAKLDRVGLALDDVGLAKHTPRTRLHSTLSLFRGLRQRSKMTSEHG